MCAAGRRTGQQDRLNPLKFAMHSMHTKATLIYRRTGNLHQLGCIWLVYGLDATENLGKIALCDLDIIVVL